jgi:hypothetical protein
VGQNVYAGDILRLSHSRASVDLPRVDVGAAYTSLPESLPQILPVLISGLNASSISSYDKRSSSTGLNDSFSITYAGRGPALLKVTFTFVTDPSYADHMELCPWLLRRLLSRIGCFRPYAMS